MHQRRPVAVGAAGSPLRRPRQTTSGPTRRTTAASTAPPSEYRPHNESPLAGFYRPVEGAFSVFRRFRVYGALWLFSRLRCASTLPRCKGRVATRLRRRERGLRPALILSFAECTEMISEYQQATDLTAGVFLCPFHPHCIAAILASYHRRDISGRESVEIFLLHFRQIAAA